MRKLVLSMLIEPRDASKESKTEGVDGGGKSTPNGSSAPRPTQRVQKAPRSSTKDKRKSLVAPLLTLCSNPQDFRSSNCPIPSHSTPMIPSMQTLSKDPKVRSLTIELHLPYFVSIFLEIFLKDHLEDVGLLRGKDNLFFHSLSLAHYHGYVFLPSSFLMILFSTARLPFFDLFRLSLRQI